MSIWKDFLSLFVDPGCYSCGQKLTAQESWVCLHCLDKFPLTNFSTNPTNNELYQRIAGRVDIAGASSLFFFDKKGKLQKLVRAFKYQNAAPLAVQMGKYMGAHLQEAAFLPIINAIVPVPLHPKKLRKRGYNQAERLAYGLGRELGIPLQSNLLVRNRNTRTQTRKSRDDRWKNVSGAFEVMQSPPAHILLVDDVVTTGATLEACIQAIHAEAPETRIHVLCLAMTRGR